MTGGRIPDSIKDPRSPQADRAKGYLYGGVAFIVGIVALIAGIVYLFLGNSASAATLAVLGLVLTLAGFLIARYGT